MLRYGVIAGCTNGVWQSACLEALERSGIARLVCVVAVSDENAHRDTEHLRALDLDFCLSFCDRKSALQFAGAGRYGVWQFAFGDLRRFSAEVPAFWEVYHSYDVTAAALVKLVDGDSEGVVLKSGYFPTIHESFARNADVLYAEMPGWLVQVCREIRDGNAAYFYAPPVPRAPRRYGAPNALQMLALRSVEMENAVRRYLRIRFYSIDWNVFALNGSAGDFIGRDAPASVTALCDKPKGVFLADPFVVTHHDRTYILCEEYRNSTNRGTLAAIELASGLTSRPHTVIEEGYHLSYPQIFEHEGEMYCVAETGQANSVGLYRATEFPYRWQYVHTLLPDVRAIDSTLLRHDGKWWLFCTSGTGPRGGDHSHLCIWYADDLFGKWTPHAGNPVKIDVRSSRPAGPFFVHQGRLYRPAQDCSGTYGGAIRINRVDILGETAFEECTVGTIRPPSREYNRGIHTISSAGNWCIVDAKRYVFNPAGFTTVAKDGAKQLLSAMGISLKRRLASSSVDVAGPHAAGAEITARH